MSFPHGVSAVIPFNRPPRTGNEDRHVLAAMSSDKMSGDGPYGMRCQGWFEEHLACKRALLVPSCTHALEMAAILLDLQPGDEVIMPSYTFVSTANAFALRGANIVFIDVRPDTMNIDEALIEAAITERTRAIVVVHYAGVGCEMDSIMALAGKHRLLVIEDAAQGMLATYKGRPLGSIGHLGAFSFHETKNFTSGGEGGLLIINDERLLERAEVVREKGTNRKKFLRGMVDKYTWVDIGSSYLPSELQAAYLWGQLEVTDEMLKGRLHTWHSYMAGLGHLEQRGLITLPVIPADCRHNGHMVYLKTADLEQRTTLINHLKSNGILAVFHYVPLHSAPAGRRFGRFHGTDRVTTKDSERLLRLPIWHGISPDEVATVVRTVDSYFTTLGRA